MVVAVKEIPKSEARDNRARKAARLRLRRPSRAQKGPDEPLPVPGLGRGRSGSTRKQAMHDGLSVPIRFKHPNGSVVRQDARAPDGGPSASDPGYLVKDLLDAHSIEGALLNGFVAGGLISAPVKHGGEHCTRRGLQRLFHRGMVERRSPAEVRTCGTHPGSSVLGGGGAAHRPAPAGCRDDTPVGNTAKQHDMVGRFAVRESDGPWGCFPAKGTWRGVPRYAVESRHRTT